MSGARRAAKLFLVGALVAAGCAEEPPGNLLAGPIQPSWHGCPGVQLSIADAAGASVQLGPGQPRPAMLLFMSRASANESSTLLTTFDERTLDAPVDTLAIVDLRQYGGGVTRRLANWRLKRSAEESRTRRRERRQARGVDASPEAVNRWHLVGDFDGALFKRFGVEPEPDHPIGFVVDRAGGVSGPYRDVDALVAAVARANRSRSGTATGARRCLRAER
jgi:hypothetical protein